MPEFHAGIPGEGTAWESKLNPNEYAVVTSVTDSGTVTYTVLNTEMKMYARYERSDSDTFNNLFTALDL